MPIHHRELTKRLNTELNLAAFASFLDTALAHFGFEEDTLFDTVLEEGDGHRVEGETRSDQLVALFTPELWPRLHQVILSNQWITGMNLKLHWIRRLHGSALTVTWDWNAPEKTPSVASVLAEGLERLGEAKADPSASTPTEELERLFGAMLLTPNVAEASREAFLSGDFSFSLTAAHRVLEKRLGVLLGTPLEKIGNLEELFQQEPPCLLLPDLSGPRLQLELTGLARVLTGVELLLQPLLRGREAAPADPAAVLKKLVLISFLVERLETAVRNPAVEQRKLGRTGRGAATARPARGRTRKTPAVSKLRPGAKPSGRKPGKSAGLKVKIKSR
jgi:hypothetical protein